MAESSGQSSGRRSSYAGSGNASRPLSYASVVTGTPSNPLGQSARVGGFAQHSPAYTNTSLPPQYLPDARATRSSAPEDHDTNVHNGISVHRRGTSASSNSRTLGSGPRIQPFTIPQYLQNTRYAQKLQTVYNARVRALREVSSANDPISPGSIWQRQSSARIAPSHRGMTYDIIESNPPVEDDVMPLPSHLSSVDKYKDLDLFNEGLDVKYNGVTGKELEAASIRSDRPMPAQCGIFYYEVTIIQKHKDCVVAIGFSAAKVSLERLPGWEAESWGYHGDEGKVFAGAQNGQPYKSGFGTGDIIGCGVDFNKGHAFFTKNGLDLGVACSDLDLSTPLFPCIGMKKHSGVFIKANFGASPFSYDIVNRMNQEMDQVQRQITRTKTSGLHPGYQTEAAFTSDLIAQFLTHGGFVDTAKEFLAQVQSQNEDVELSRPALHNPETEDARPRQQIRQAILSGDIDTALEATQEHFPLVMTKFPQVIFQLKCRKFVELVSKAAEMSKSISIDTKGKSQSNGSARSSNHAADTFDQAMDVDDEQQSTPNGHGRSGLQSSGDSNAEYDSLTSEAIKYGRALKAEYGDKDSEQCKILHDIFSLMPYYNPSASQNGHLLESSGRSRVAEELNAAILSKLPSTHTAIELTEKQLHLDELHEQPWKQYAFKMKLYWIY